MSKQVTRNELVNLLSERAGSIFVAFVARTKEKLLKKSRETKEPNPFGEAVFKVARVKGECNTHYDKAVLRALVREGKLPAEVIDHLLAGLSVDQIFERLEAEQIDNPFRRGGSWHEPALDGKGRLTPFARHKKDRDHLYLRVNRQRCLEAHYYDEAGVEIEAEKLAPYLEKASANENQGLDDPLNFRLYGLESLVEVAADNEKYEVVG